MTDLTYRSPRTEVRESAIHGRGLFARTGIARGEIVAVKGGHVLTGPPWNTLEPSLGSAEIQLTEDLFIAPVDHAERHGGMLYVNHCCDPNAELVRYAEAWAQKILLNTPVETVRDVATRLRINPMVTIAVRSDGSVESVTFVLSSGVAEVDEAIRRIVRSHEHYQAFPPALARDYDVIEIRRTWHFDSAVRLY